MRDIDRLPEHDGHALVAAQEVVSLAPTARPWHPVVIVVDSLGADFAHAMQTSAWLRQAGQCRTVHTGPLTISYPALAIMSAGLEADSTGVRDNLEKRKLASSPSGRRREAGLSVRAGGGLCWQRTRRQRVLTRGTCYAAPVPISSVYAIELTTTDDDIDQVGHVSNIRYVEWLQNVATSHSAALGLGMDEYREIGSVFVIRRHEIDYLRPAFLGERIRVQTQVESWKQVSSIRMNSVWRIADSEGAVLDKPVELARSKALWAFVRFRDGRPQRIPEPVKEVFRTAQPED